MGKALMVSATAGGVLASGDEINWFGLGSKTATEASAQASCTEDASFTGLRSRILSGGSGTNTFQFRDAGANGQNVASVAGAGLAEDTTNTDSLQAGDLFNLAYTDDGSDPTGHWNAINVAFASGHGNFHGTFAGAGTIHDVPSATRFIPLAGGLQADGGATEASVQWKNRGYTSWEALQVRVTANARTNTSDFRNRVNGADGAALCSFAAGVTGLVIDTTVGDALAAGDLIGVSVALDTGVEDLTVTLVLGTFKSTTLKSETWSGIAAGTARAASATPDYYTIGGLTASIATDASARIKPGFAAVVQNLRCYLSANTYTGDGTLKLYQNGSAVITLTLTASGGAGWYENTSDSVVIDADDELSFEIDEGATGSITIQSIGVTFSGVAYTLAADAGSYGLTGSTAGLRAARKIAAVTGSYVLTGSAAGLAAGRKIAAVSGVYALTGSVAGLSAGRKIAAASGAYALTGSAAGLKAARKIAAETGSYVLTGSVATLVYSPAAGSYILVADSGVYGLTGSAAGLSAGRKIAAATGAYSLTGSTVALRADRRLVAVAGQYTLTGSAATLSASGVDICASIPRDAAAVSDARPAAATSVPRTDC